MINCWAKALVNFAFGFATASVVFLLAPTKGGSSENDEELEALEKGLGEVEKELKELEKEINELPSAVGEEENK